MIEVVVGANGLVSARCRYAPATNADDDTESASVELPRSADALGAAFTRRCDPLLLRLHGASWARRAIQSGLVAVSMVGVVSCLALPAMAARRSRDAFESRLAELRMYASPALRVSHELDSVSTSLNEIGRFASSRRSMLLLLADLARMLPDSAYIDALHVDSVGGTFVVLAPSPSEMLTAPRSGSIDAPLLAGAITPDGAGARALRRLPFRFRFRERAANR